MGAMASQITNLMIVFSIVHSGANQRKLCVIGLCAGISPVTGEFPAQMDSYAENGSIWWRHQGQIEWWCQVLPIPLSIWILALIPFGLSLAQITVYCSDLTSK